MKMKLKRNGHSLEVDFFVILKTFSNIMHGKFVNPPSKMASKTLVTAVTRAWLTHKKNFLLVRGFAVDKKETIYFRETRPACRKDGRLLLNPEDVWKHNAWDNVQWGEEQIKEAEEKLKKNSSYFLSPEEAAKLENESSQFWDSFYSTHENKFFKDRHWLFTECPELTEIKETAELTSESDFPGKQAASRVMEVGCGTGSTVFPLLTANKNLNQFIYCCDFSSKAVELVKTNPDYNPNRCHAFVCDISAPEIMFPFPEASLDVILLIFVLSALQPQKLTSAIKQLAKCLKPGGRIFFRDYGRYDMAELRFKPGRCISEHFYVRGDGTRVYFFNQEELRAAFEEAGLVEEQNFADRRLLVNRGRQLTMYRVWIQCKYRRPV